MLESNRNIDMLYQTNLYDLRVASTFNVFTGKNIKVFREGNHARAL